jgi:beta-lactamase class D
MQIVKDIMVIEQDSTYTLRGKTGWGIIDDTNYGWFVGYIEKDENIYFFATNIASDQPEDSFAQARKAISLNILKELGILG